MKKIFLILCLLLSVFTITSCKDDENDKVEETPIETPKEKANYIKVGIADAIMMANQVGETLTEINLCISGTISSVSNVEFGNMVVSDGVDSINIYGLCDANGTQYNNLEDKPVKGDKITLYGKVHTFNGVPEFKEAVIVSFTHVTPEVDDTYQEVTIKQAREANVGDKLVISGVVAKITYAFGHVPNGFYVVDETESIYVYGDDAQRVSVGNTVKLGGTKDYYVLEKEQNNALKYGYKGCCQLKDSILLENEATESEFNKDWITESTVKSIIDTPVTENITTTIFKVNALIKKVPGSGFTNYYIEDIDGETGSYVYTANNGSDFEWLDEFDGKICTVYLSPINCKSTSSGCNWRFIPILVIDEKYQFDLKDAPDYAITYKGLDQFKKIYSSDPALELVTTVSSELLGFDGVTLEYQSSNTDVIYLETTEDKVIFHTKSIGTATVTITAKYQDYTAVKEVSIEVTDKIEYETISIADAIASSDDTQVTIKGIVVSSLVNQSGFYISDDTGIIAVTCSAEQLEDISLGNMVVVTGTRIHRKDADKTHAGQSVIDQATILTNYYGSHEYSTELFNTKTSIAELYSLDVNTDYTTTIYVVTGVVKITTGQYSSNIDIYDVEGKNKIGLYCSSAKQYSWLEDYVGQEVVLEIAMCNWNNKTYYRGCVISVTCDGVKTNNNLNFQ